MKTQLQQKTLSNLELAEFFNQMGLMLHSGISPSEGLHLLCEDAASDDERELLQHMIETMESAGFLYDACKDCGVFPSYALHMIKLGEETGILDQVLSGLSNHYTREENFSGMIRSSLFYPALMLGMMFLVVIVLLTKVMPVFEQVFTQLGQEMTGFSAGLLAIGETLSNYSIIFIIVIVALVILLLFGRKHLPFQKHIQEQLSACRFCNGMAIALKSGMTAEQAMELSANLVENPTFAAKIAACKALLDEGCSLTLALKNSKILTGSYGRIAYIAEKSGVLDEALGQIADEYEYAVNTKITSVIAILEPTLVIILSIIVGIILFSVMFPLLGIMTQL